MAYPTILAVSSGNLAANTVTFSLSLPPTISSGDFLLALLATDGVQNVTWDQSAAGTWTSLYSIAGSTAVSLRAFYKVADGTEDNLQLKCYVPSTAEMYAYHISLWTGVHATTPLQFTSTYTLTVTASVPGLTVSTGTDMYTWIAVGANDGNVAVSTYPTSYVNTSNPRAAAAGGCGIGFATIDASATAKAATRFVWSGAEDGVMVHMALRPAAEIPDTTVSLALVAAGLTHYQPSLRVYRNVQLGLVASGLTFYTQSMAVADVTINAGLVASGLTFFTQAMAQPTRIYPDVKASGVEHFAPSIAERFNLAMPVPFTGLTFYTPSIAATRLIEVGAMGSGVELYAPAFGSRYVIYPGFKDTGLSIYGLTFDTGTGEVTVISLVAVSVNGVQLSAAEVAQINVF